MIKTRQMNVYEVFEAIETAKSRKAKIKLLQENDIMPVRDVLQGTFDDRITWKLSTRYTALHSR